MRIGALLFYKDHIVFFAQQGFVQVPLAQAEPASALGLQQAQLERARELTARARRVSTFMGY